MTRNIEVTTDERLATAAMGAQIRADLTDKLKNDVLGYLRRIAAITPPPHLPMFCVAGAVCVASVAAEIDKKNGRPIELGPDRDSVFLAALVIAHTALGDDHVLAIRSAYKDMAAIKSVGN